MTPHRAAARGFSLVPCVVLALLAACNAGPAPSPTASSTAASGGNAIGAPDNAAVPVEPDVEPGAMENKAADASATQAGAVIPAAFRGVWAARPDQCSATSEQRMEVRARMIVFYESAAQVRRLEQIGPDSVRLSLAFTGEGSAWSRENVLTLSDNGATLRRREEDAAPIVYHRCIEDSDM